MKSSDAHFVFFGTPELAVTVLDELKMQGLVPSLIVTAPDKPQGRGLITTPPPVKKWANKNNIPVIQPPTLKKDPALIDTLMATHASLFVVAAYGKIIPQSILTIPPRGTVNVHPSLLPKHRGPSPIQAQILADEPTVGVSIMLLDAEMDHGPIIEQKRVTIDPTDWPIQGSTLEDLLAHEGGKLLGNIISKWIDGSVPAVPQDHTQATYCRLIRKEDALINLANDPYQNFLKIKAYDTWPRPYFFTEKNGKTIRVVITDAEYHDGALILKKVIPEGRKEIEYSLFERN